MMNNFLAYAAYGWMVFAGTAHFIADVVSQILRDRRAAGTETTLFYGLHSAFALGQTMFGLLALYMVWRGSQLVDEWPIRVLSLVAALCWLLIAVLFIEYWQPKAVAALLLVLMVARLVVR